MTKYKVGNRNVWLVVLVIAIVVIAILATAYLPGISGSASNGTPASTSTAISTATSSPKDTPTVTSVAPATSVFLNSQAVTPDPTQTPTKMLEPTPQPTVTPSPTPIPSNSRGYLTTPVELAVISEKADQGLEPYKGAVEVVIEQANRDWDYSIKENVKCNSSDTPAWNDNEEGTAVLHAKALA